MANVKNPTNEARNLRADLWSTAKDVPAQGLPSRLNIGKIVKHWRGF
jgi:hypothetical protein